MSSNAHTGKEKDSPSEKEQSQRMKHQQRHGSGQDLEKLSEYESNSGTHFKDFGFNLVSCGQKSRTKHVQRNTFSGYGNKEHDENKEE